MSTNHYPRKGYTYMATSNVEQVLTEARDGLLDNKAQIEAALDRAYAAVNAGLEQTQETSGKLVPDSVTGTIQNYRFGKFKTEMHPSGDESTPVHVFECDLGNEVLLHIVLGSDRWDTFVAQLDDEAVEALENGSNIGELLEGKRVTLLRDTAYGRFVPVGLASEEDQEPLATDASGNSIYKGSKVYSPDIGLNVTVVQNDENGYIYGRRDDGLEGSSGVFDEETKKQLTKLAPRAVSLV